MVFCKMHEYNNQVETGYYETIIWKKNVGITLYKSGYGAQRDSMEIELEESDNLVEEYQTIMERYTDENIYQVVEEDFDGSGEEAFVLVNYNEKDEDGYEVPSGCELWYVKGDSVESITQEKNCSGGNIQLLSIGATKHIIFNAENARLGDGTRTAIYGVDDGTVKTLFEQKHLSLYATENGLIGYEGDYYLYDDEVDGWMAYCSLSYQFHWNDKEGKYEEYVAEEISEEEFLKFSGAKEILDMVLKTCNYTHTGEYKITKVEREYLKRENDTIDINLIISHKNGEKRKNYISVKVNGNMVEYEGGISLNEGNKKISLIQELN